MLIPSTPDDAIERDRWGRPVIDGVPHTRVSTIAKALDDQSALIDWSAKVALIGASLRPDLVTAAYAHRDDDKMLRDLAKQAKEAGGAGSAARVGTALHALTEQMDRLPTTVDRDAFIDAVPGEDDRRDLRAYRDATAAFEMLGAEVFVVDPHRKVAGTADRVLRVKGKTILGDLKTSKGALSWLLGPTAMQLAAYADAKPYEADGWPDGFDPSIGLLIHLPQGSGTCTLTWLDLDAAREGLDLAVRVRDWRSGHHKKVVYRPR